MVTNSEDVIIADAIKAASNFVDVCCIHAAYMAGRKTEPGADESVQSAENFLLLFPGNLLKLTDIINAKKFRHIGKKEKAVESLINLQQNGLGILKEVPSSKHLAHQVSNIYIQFRLYLGCLGWVINLIYPTLFTCIPRLQT